MRPRVYSTSVRSIQGPVSASTAAMASSFGMNDNVISLICVAAWKMPTMRPTPSAVSSSGAASMSVISSAWRPTVTTVSGDMNYLPEEVLSEETLCERAHDQRPAIDEHEQHDLERQRDQHRREHHHAHRHEHARDHEIDDHERDEEQEADLERGLELAGDERRHQDAERHVGGLRETLAAGDPHEGRDVGFARLFEHEALERADGALERDRGLDRAGEIGLRGLGVHLVDHRSHDEEGQEQRQADEHLVGRRLAG